MLLFWGTLPSFPSEVDVLSPVRLTALRLTADVSDDITSSDQQWLSFTNFQAVYFLQIFFCPSQDKLESNPPKQARWTSSWHWRILTEIPLPQSKKRKRKWARCGSLDIYFWCVFVCQHVKLRDRRLGAGPPLRSPSCLNTSQQNFQEPPPVLLLLWSFSLDQRQYSITSASESAVEALALHPGGSESWWWFECHQNPGLQ